MADHIVKISRGRGFLRTVGRNILLFFKNKKSKKIHAARKMDADDKPRYFFTWSIVYFLHYTRLINNVSTADCYLKQRQSVVEKHASQIIASKFEMCDQHQNEASRACLLNLPQTLVFLKFSNFSKRLHGIRFISLKTGGIEVTPTPPPI